MPRKKKEKTIVSKTSQDQEMPLPGLGRSTEKLTPQELEEFKQVGVRRQLIQAEVDKATLQQQNLFLRISNRLGGRDVEGCQVDVENSLLVFPEQEEAVSTPKPSKGKRGRRRAESNGNGSEELMAVESDESEAVAAA